MSSLTTIFVPGTGYRDSFSPAAQFCFPPAVIPLPHTFDFLRPWCHLAAAASLAAVAPLAAVAGCATHRSSQHTLDQYSLRGPLALDKAHSPDSCCFSPLPQCPNLPLLCKRIYWKALSELFVTCSGEIKASFLPLSSSNWADLTMLPTSLLTSSSKHWKHSLLEHRSDKWIPLKTPFLFK